MEKQTDYSSLSSSATHRTTQPSTTLNRKYVKRPVVKRVVRDEPKQERHAPVTRVGAHSKSDTTALSSRLVNMHIRAPKPEPRKISLADIPSPVPTVSEEELRAIENTPEPITPVQEESISEPTQALNITAQPEENNMEDNQEDSIHISHATPPIIKERPVKIDTTPIPREPVNTMPSHATSPMVQRFSTPPATNANTSFGLVSPLLGQSDNFESNDSLPKSVPEPVEKVIPKNADPASKESIEAIARAAAAAIASIHNATDPSEVYAEMDKLKRTTEEIQAQDSDNNNNTDSQTEVGISKLKKVAKESNSITISSKKATPKESSKPVTISASSHRVVKNNTPKIKTRSNIEPSPAELKDKAIRNALRSMATIDQEPTPKKPEAKPAKAPKVATTPRPTPIKRKHGGKRFILAFACAAACVALIVGFVGTNIPDISVKVAALQTGIQASYPSYIPREFTLRDISSEDGRVVINFDSEDGKTFSLIEEKSSWDSSALVRNYVEPNWQDEYTTTHEQGITIYVSNSNAAWVNGGVLYKITAEPNVLTTKQLRNIVTSL